MNVANINLHLDADAARIYSTASPEKQEKLRLLISFWLREFETPSLSLSQIMDRISDNAEKRGLTPEVLVLILNEKR